MNGLENLNDIIVPNYVNDTFSMLFFIVIGVLFLLFLVGIILFVIYYRKRRFVRIAKKMLNELDYNQHNLAICVDSILKQFFLTLYPRERFVSLSEKQWWAFLDDNLPINQQNKWKKLVGNPYKKNNQAKGLLLIKHAILTVEHSVKRKKEHHV